MSRLQIALFSVLFAVAFFLIGVSLTLSILHESGYIPIRERQTVIIEDVAIGPLDFYTVEATSLSYLSIGVNEAEGKENIGSYLIQAPRTMYATSEHTLTYDAKKRIFYVLQVGYLVYVKVH